MESVNDFMLILADYHPLFTTRVHEYISRPTCLPQTRYDWRNIACNYIFVESLCQPCYIMAVTLLRTLIQLSGDRHCCMLPLLVLAGC